MDLLLIPAGMERYPVEWQLLPSSELAALPLFAGPEWREFTDELIRRGMPLEPSSVEALAFWAKICGEMPALLDRPVLHLEEPGADDFIDSDEESESDAAESRRLHELEMKDLEDEQDAFMALEYFHDDTNDSDEGESDDAMEELDDPECPGSTDMPEPAPTEHIHLYPPVEPPWKVKWDRYAFLHL